MHPSRSLFCSWYTTQVRDGRHLPSSATPWIINTLASLADSSNEFLSCGSCLAWPSFPSVESGETSSSGRNKTVVILEELTRFFTSFHRPHRFYRMSQEAMGLLHLLDPRHCSSWSPSRMWLVGLSPWSPPGSAARPPPSSASSAARVHDCSLLSHHSISQSKHCRFVPSPARLARSDQTLASTSCTFVVVSSVPLMSQGVSCLPAQSIVLSGLMSRNASTVQISSPV